ncbi:MAG TPA: hypothetical protein VFV58_39245 [Blastocatellia bacterium]|nr:hypothetical protein [Blastocatellia bacterium]
MPDPGERATALICDRCREKLGVKYLLGRWLCADCREVEMTDLILEVAKPLPLRRPVAVGKGKR